MFRDVWVVANNQVAWTGNVLEDQRQESLVYSYMDGSMEMRMIIMIFVSHVIHTRKHPP